MSVSILSYGASTTSTDNTAAINRAIAAAKAQNTTVEIPAGNFRHAGVIRSDGVMIIGQGDASILTATRADTQAVILSGDGAGISNVTLAGAGGERLSSYEAGGVAVLNATNFTVDRVTIVGASAAGIHISGSSGGKVIDNVLSYAGADSIHFSNYEGGNHDVEVSGNRIDHSGDDGIAVVSYAGDEASHNINVRGNSVVDQIWGRGYSVVGGNDITIEDNFFDNNIAGFAGIYIASEAEYGTLPVSNVLVKGNVIENAGGNHGSIQLYASGSTIKNVTIDGNRIYDSKNVDILLNGRAGQSGIVVINNHGYGSQPLLSDQADARPTNAGNIVHAATARPSLSDWWASRSNAVSPVDVMAPTVLSVAASGTDIVSGAGNLNAGKVVNLAVTFSEVVSVAGGAPTLVLNDGGTATYSSGSGTDTLVFAHIVRAGQNTADLAVTSLALGGATIKDAAGNAANPAAAAGFNPSGALRIDTAAPSVASITASGASLTAGRGTIGPGSAVTFTVTMSEAVTVTGRPTLSLSSGGTATFAGGSGTAALTFTHTVAAGQSSPDLAVRSFNLAGGTVRDAAGNAANLSAATNYNPAGTLKVGASSTASQASPPIAPTVTAKLSTDTGTSAIDRITSNPALTGTADPNTTIRFTIDGRAVAATARADAAGVWTYAPTSLTDSQHTIVASATNAAGVTGNASLTFTLDRTVPSPVISGGAVANGRVSLNGIGGVGDQVSVYDGAVLLGSTTTAANGTWSFAASAAAGSHTYRVTGVDLAGNTGNGTSGYVLASATPTRLPSAFTSISAANGQVTLRGTSGVGDQISMYDGMTWLGFATTGADGTWSFSTKAAADATHNFGFNATDTKGTERKGTGRGLLGSNGRDALAGSTGDDVIGLGLGGDNVTGGAGADTFAVMAAPKAASNLDRITDFTSGADKLALPGSAFAALSPGELRAAAFVQAIAAVTPDQHVIYNQATGIVSYDSDGSGAGAAVAVVQLNPGQTLTVQDIKVV